MLHVHPSLFLEGYPLVLRLRVHPLADRSDTCSCIHPAFQLPVARHCCSLHASSMVLWNNGEGRIPLAGDVYVLSV